MEILLFGYLFPWTGLKAIVMLPILFGICIGIIILGAFYTKKLNFKSRIAVWLLLFVINSLIASHLFPQEFRPTVLKQIGYTFNVVTNYETISEDDLLLYSEDEYYPYDKFVADHRERYVAALYKFKDKIERDGTSFVYGEKDKPILDNTRIEKHFDNGQDKLIWWMLEIFKN